MQIERSRNIGGEHDAGSCPPAVKYTTKDERVKFHGILKREERTADFMITCEHEI